MHGVPGRQFPVHDGGGELPELPSGHRRLRVRIGRVGLVHGVPRGHLRRAGRRGLHELRGGLLPRDGRVADVLAVQGGHEHVVGVGERRVDRVLGLRHGEVRDFGGAGLHLLRR